MRLYIVALMGNVGVAASSMAWRTPALHVETQNLASPLRPDMVIPSWRRKILRLYIVVLMGNVGLRLGVACSRPEGGPLSNPC